MLQVRAYPRAAVNGPSLSQHYSSTLAMLQWTVLNPFSGRVAQRLISQHEPLWMMHLWHQAVSVQFEVICINRTEAPFPPVFRPSSQRCQRLAWKFGNQPQRTLKPTCCIEWWRRGGGGHLDTVEHHHTPSDVSSRESCTNTWCK